MFRRPLVPVFAIFFCVLLGTANGQLTDEVRERLQKEIETAKGKLDPGRLPNLAAIKQDLMKQVSEVEEYLDRYTEPENRDAWLKYLNLDPLVTAIRDSESEGLVAREAEALRDRLIGTVPGLELTIFQRLRDSVGQLVKAVRFQDPDNSVKLIEAQLSALAKIIDMADEVPSPDHFSAISLRVALLNSAGQAPGLVDSVREVFGQSNVAIKVSAEMIDQVLGREVSRTLPVKDVILGTRLTGTAVMNGNVGGKLIPSGSDAKIELSLKGTVDTKNDGVNGPIRLKSVSKGTVSLTRLLTVSADGIEFGKTESEVSISTSITDMKANSDLALRVGRKQAAKKKPQADRIAKEKLRTRVTEQFESEMEDIEANASSKLLDQAKPILERLSLTPPSQVWRSSADQLAVDVNFRAEDQLSSVIGPTVFQSTSLFSIQVHESAIENAFTVMLAGRTLDEERLNELMDSAGAPKPEKPEEEEDAPFEISFSRSRPVIFEARDGLLRVGLRGTRFAQGDRNPLNKAMEITSTYEVVIDDKSGAVLKRVGEVEVDFPRERLSLRDAGLKPIIQKEFSAIFPENILDQSIQIAEDAEMETLRGREFRAKEILVTDGWLSIAFQ
ncbi:hypothetical protein OAH34_02680 [bacterium]|nr:hypothetical protein [bacterium]